MYQEDNEYWKDIGEEDQCEICGEWFPADHLTEGICIDCINSQNKA